MARDDSSPSGSNEDKLSSGESAHARGGISSRGRSGYGSESVRPHLRDQLARQKLLRPSFPPEDPQERDRTNRSQS